MTFRNILLAACLGGLLSGCALFTDANDASREYTAPAVAETYAFRCNNLGRSARMLDWAAIQKQLDASYPGMAAPIFDCDGDGTPDFTAQDVIDAGFYTAPQ